MGERKQLCCPAVCEFVQHRGASCRLSKNPFSRSGSRDTSERQQPTCPGEQEPLEQYASDDVMDDDEGVELEGGLMCVQGRGVSRAPQDEVLAGVRPGGLSL